MQRRLVERMWKQAQRRVLIVVTASTRLNCCGISNHVIQNCALQ